MQQQYEQNIGGGHIVPKSWLYIEQLDSACGSLLTRSVAKRIHAESETFAFLQVEVIDTDNGDYACTQCKPYGVISYYFSATKITLGGFKNLGYDLDKGAKALHHHSQIKTEVMKVEQ